MRTSSMLFGIASAFVETSPLTLLRMISSKSYADAHGRKSSDQHGRHMLSLHCHTIVTHPGETSMRDGLVLDFSLVA